MSHPKTKKSAMLWDLVELSYSLECEPTEEDALFLEKTIAREKNPELKEALEDLDMDSILILIFQTTTSNTK